MEFYDANLLYGKPFLAGMPHYSNMETIAQIDGALTRSGAKGGLVRPIMYDVAGPQTARKMLIADLKTTENDLYGICPLSASDCEDAILPEALPAYMKENKLMAIRFPYKMAGQQDLLCRPMVLEDYLSVAQEKRIPVFFDQVDGYSLEEIWDFMQAFPKLTAILTHRNTWPSDRVFRPFLTRFPSLLLCLATVITDQGIEHLVQKYGAERFLYGSSFPMRYMGGAMFQLKAADLSDADKESIAGGNFLRIRRWLDD